MPQGVGHAEQANVPLLGSVSLTPSPSPITNHMGEGSTPP